MSVDESVQEAFDKRGEQRAARKGGPDNPVEFLLCGGDSGGL